MNLTILLFLSSGLLSQENCFGCHPIDVFDLARHMTPSISPAEHSCITEPWVEAVCQYFDSAKNRISSGHVWSVWEDKVLEATKCPLTDDEKFYYTTSGQYSLYNNTFKQVVREHALFETRWISRA